MSTELANSVTNSGQSETRGQRLWRKACEPRAVKFSLERAKLVTASYKETEGLPVPIRRAKAFEKIVTEIPIFIPDDQLLVGDFASSPNVREWYCEHIAGDMLTQIEAGESEMEVAPEDMPAIREICDYWTDRAVRDTFFQYIEIGFS